MNLLVYLVSRLTGVLRLCNMSAALRKLQHQESRSRDSKLDTC
jgi:hypothetical protein